MPDSRVQWNTRARGPILSVPSRRIRSIPGWVPRALLKREYRGQTIARPDAGRAGGKTAIRPFKVATVPEAELVELRRRIDATRFPERETVTDASQGAQLATTQKLARYWRMYRPVCCWM